MKFRGIIAGFLLGAVLSGSSVPAKAVEAPVSAAVQATALGVCSYKGTSLAAGERSTILVKPYGTSVTAASSNPGVIAVEEVYGYLVMIAKAPGTAEVSITDEAGRTASMTMTVSGGLSAAPKTVPQPVSAPDAAKPDAAQIPADSNPVVNSEWSHNPDADLTANMDIRLEMVRLINQVRREHGRAELPIDDRLMNATQDVSTQHLKEHTQYEREAVIAYERLLEDIPMDKIMLNKFLKAGVIRDGELFSTDRGISLGTSLSPILGNMILDGLQSYIYDHLYPNRGVDYKNGKSDSPCTIRNRRAQTCAAELQPISRRRLSSVSATSKGCSEEQRKI